MSVGYADEPMISMSSPVQKIPLQNGDHLEYVTQIISGPLSQVREQLALLGVDENGRQTVPVEAVVVTKPGSPKSEAEELVKEMKHLMPLTNTYGVKVYSPGILTDFYEETNNKVFTLIRFLLNGTSIGVTLIYSSGVPVTQAFIVGTLAGSISGALQYKVGAFRDWIRAHKLVSNFGYPVSGADTAIAEWGKRTFNYSLELTEEFAKFGLTEFAYTSFMTATMYFLHAGSLPATFTENFRRVLTVVSQSTFSQGTADLGLFKDVEMQGQYGGWSEYNVDYFRNAAAFAISAASVAVTAFQLANPGVAGEIPLYFFNMPYGFALISASGLAFYIHGLIAQWANSPAPVHWIPLDFGD